MHHFLEWKKSQNLECCSHWREVLGKSKYMALPAFAAFSGVDQVEGFVGKRKASQWSTWNIFPQVNEAFQVMSTKPSVIYVEKILPTIECYTVLLHERNNEEDKVDIARLILFYRKKRQLREHSSYKERSLPSHSSRSVSSWASVETSLTPRTCAPSTSGFWLD